MAITATGQNTQLSSPVYAGSPALPTLAAEAPSAIGDSVASAEPALGIYTRRAIEDAGDHSHGVKNALHQGGKAAGHAGAKHIIKKLAHMALEAGKDTVEAAPKVAEAAAVVA